jgi:hypothetical protein
MFELPRKIYLASFIALMLFALAVAVTADSYVWVILGYLPVGLLTILVEPAPRPLRVMDTRLTCDCERCEALRDKHAE